MFGCPVWEGASPGLLPIAAQDISDLIDEAALGRSSSKGRGAVPELGAVALVDPVRVAPEADRASRFSLAELAVTRFVCGGYGGCALRVGRQRGGAKTVAGGDGSRIVPALSVEVLALGGLETGAPRTGRGA